MNIEETQLLVEYCVMRCGKSNCITCKGGSEESCEGVFLLDLFNILDFKNLEQDNMNKILLDIEKTYEKSVFRSSLTLIEYSVLELFINDKYKLTKKEDYEKKLSKVLNI